MPVPGNGHHCVKCEATSGRGRASKSHNGDCCPKHEYICEGTYGLRHKPFAVLKPEHSLNGKSECEQCKLAHRSMAAQQDAERKKNEKRQAKMDSKKEFTRMSPTKERTKPRHQMSQEEEAERRMKEREFKRRQQRGLEQKRYEGTKMAKKEKEASGASPSRPSSPYRISRRSATQMPMAEDIYGLSRGRSTRQPSPSKMYSSSSGTRGLSPSKPRILSPTRQTLSPSRMGRERSPSPDRRARSPSRATQRPSTSTGMGMGPPTSSARRPSMSTRPIFSATIPDLTRAQYPVPSGRATGFAPTNPFEPPTTGMRAPSPVRPQRSRRDQSPTRPVPTSRLYAPISDQVTYGPEPTQPRGRSPSRPNQTNYGETQYVDYRRRSPQRPPSPVRPGRDFYSVDQYRRPSQEGLTQYGQGGYQGFITHGPLSRSPERVRRPRRSPDPERRDSGYEASYDKNKGYGYGYGPPGGGF